MSPHKDLPIIQQLNKSSILVTIVAVSQAEHISKSEKVMQMYRAILETKSPQRDKTAIGLPFLLELVNSRAPWTERLEHFITLFQVLLVPTKVISLGLGTSPFLHFVGLGRIKEVMVCVKLGCDLTARGNFELLQDVNALHVVSYKGHLKLFELLMETSQFAEVGCLDSEL